MLSPTHDFEIFLSKISGKTPGEVLSAADREIQGIFASPKKRSASFAYVLDLLLLTSYIRVPPQKQDRRGPVPNELKPTLLDLGLTTEEEPLSPTIALIIASNCLPDLIAFLG
jgi:hypothetical protein